MLNLKELIKEKLAKVTKSLMKYSDSTKKADATEEPFFQTETQKDNEELSKYTRFFFWYFIIGVFFYIIFLVILSKNS
jgi:hypothetical protein